MSILLNIYAEEEELKEIAENLANGNVEHSEIYDAVTTSAKLNNPLSNPDLLVELLKFTTAALQTTGAIVVLYTAIKQAQKPGKKIILVKESDGDSLEIDENTTEQQLSGFLN